MANLRYFMVKRDEANESAWNQAQLLVLTLAQTRDSICEPIPVSFIQTAALTHADVLLFAFLKTDCRRKRRRANDEPVLVTPRDQPVPTASEVVPPAYRTRQQQKHEGASDETCAGFAILQLHEAPRSLYIDLMCARGAGGALVNVIKQLAVRWNYSHITLSALPVAINFYRRYGFQHAELPCCAEDDDLRDMSEQTQHKRFHNEQEAVEDPEFYSLLSALVKRRLVRNKRCRKIETCSVDGFSMIYCLDKHRGELCLHEQEEDNMDE